MKDVYADKMDNLVPDFGILVKMIAFSSAKKTGRDFVKPVKLSNEHGFTYGAGLQTLEAIISSDVDDAKVRGSSMTLVSGFLVSLTMQQLTWLLTKVLSRQLLSSASRR
jgi:hypothetical protein